MRFDTLAAWLDWQATLHPKAIDMGLDRVRQVWQALGDRRFDCPILTIAGTNGKGSSVAFAEAILQAGGYRTGCYTSPHLVRYNERIRIDQREVDDAALCRAFDAIDHARGDIALTYFEFGTLAALLLFADAGLDALVLEVGLGGRLDAVNLIDPSVALITSIGLDHQNWLGDDLEQIGAEKAGILRASRPAVYSGRDMPASIAARAEALGAELKVAGVDYRVAQRAEGWELISPEQVRRALPMPALRGPRQVENAAGVLVALDTLSEVLPLDQRAVRIGLLSARLPGRFEVRPGQPTWVLDVAHNPQSAEVLDGLLGELFVPGRRVAVFGALNDKDVAGIAAAVAKRFDAWYLVDLSAQPRGLSATALVEALGELVDESSCTTAGAPHDAFERAAVQAGPDGMVVVFGSFLTVGAATEWLDRTH
jgi:dihydrofolate synthase/folylpolyglutamate synthase